MEAVGFVFILFGVLAVGSIVFGAWVALSLIKMIFRVLFGMFRSPSLGPPPLPFSAATNGHRCSRPGCQAVNAHSARFCRRCGRELDASVMRTAAVW
jgi:hypothetical protein